MDKFDRIQQLHRIFKSRRLPVSKRALAEELECTERNVQRLLDNLKIVDAPLAYDPSRKGWYYAEDPGNLFELPGLWLTADELQGLSLLLNLLESLGNGLLNNEIRVVKKEIHTLLAARNIRPSAFAERIKVLPMAHRPMSDKVFGKVSEALLNKRRLHLDYTGYKGVKTQRDISPQTLIHYRENWYLDAWCHKRQELRTFSIARITCAEILKTPAQAVGKETLRKHFTGSYGIFAGPAKNIAVLRFTPAIAHEIAVQQWHPAQQGVWEGNHYLLTIPYSDDRELLQDLLRHTPYVYVEAPAGLRSKLQRVLREGLQINQQHDKGREKDTV